MLNIKFSHKPFFKSHTLKYIMFSRVCIEKATKKTEQQLFNHFYYIYYHEKKKTV